jgi:arabinogalactan oligomer/maltooligosaccharide transport system permease protein
MFEEKKREDRMPLGKQLLNQAVCLFIALTVLYPVAWIVGMSINGRNEYRPRDIIPPIEYMSLEAYGRVLTEPTANPVSFLELARNSLMLSTGVALAAMIFGVGAAYVLSRFEFRGRRILMMAFIGVLMLPSIATIAPLFVLLNRISFSLRNSLFGVGLAMTSTALPFAIWNLKGYLDTIPKDLSDAALIDGANFNQTFIHIILPLARPALVVTFFLSFLTGWTEFALSWQFLTNPKNFTLAMSLWNMTGQFSGDTPWAVFAAMSLMVSLPVAIIYLLFQRQLVSGLTLGATK